MVEREAARPDQPAAGEVAVLPAVPAAPPARRGSWLRNRLGSVRAPWRLLAFIVLALALGPLAARLVPPVGDAYGADDALRAALACLAVAAAGATVAAAVDRHRHPLAALGLGVVPWWPVVGATALGIGLMAGVFAIESVAGLLVVRPGAAPLRPLTVLLLLLLFAAALEELVFRGYPLRVLSESIGRWPAMVAVSAMFGLAHNMNPGATALSFANTTAAGLLLALAVHRFDSLWPAIGLHFGWNATLGPLLGLPVSGLGLTTMAWDGDLTARGQRWWWLSGGDYGPEGGLVLSALLWPALWWLGRRLPAPGR